MKKKGRRFQTISLLHILAAIASLILLMIFLKFVFSSAEQEAKNTVDAFYQYEQQGEFSSSWELFHSDMKKKFTKGHYIQDRAHVFMNHFGVETFTYSLGKPEKLKTWKMSNEESVMKSVYQMTVTQTFKGKYGNFDIEQKVFVVKEKGDWKIMWDYNQ